MNVKDGITLIPILHGRSAFASRIRALCTAHRYSCIAVDIPEPFERDLLEAIEGLPFISAVVAQQASDPVYYLPTDPCDATIEALRQALQNRTQWRCIGYPHLAPPQPLPPLPDEHALSRIGFEEFASLCLHCIGNPPAGSMQDRAGQYIAWRLLDLRTIHKSILAVVHMHHFARVVYHLAREATYNLRFDAPPEWVSSVYRVNPDHLYFVLGELPFVTGKFEKERHDLFASSVDIIETFKELFRETRDELSENKDDMHALSPVRIQAAIQFLRNLTVSDNRFIPSLFDIVAAAKGVGGNSYALRVLKNAKYYPYLPFEQNEPLLGVGINRVLLPHDRSAHDAVNLFRDTAMVWRTLTIKPDPSILRKNKYRYTWNPLGMCSHVPEDRRIESFNAHLRRKAQRVAVEDYVKTERFMTSVKDGIDMRETLRNWHTGNVYVKEIPPSRGPLDTVVIVFDSDHDERYPQHATWYAEHNEESTLTFYATDPFDDLIGPGIARCRYGGLSLLFPPRPVPNPFELTQHMREATLHQRLVYGALTFTRERSVAYVAATRPDMRIRHMANRCGKTFIWIPLNTFSNETLRKLSTFHVLNGKEVRSWAARFIAD